MTIKHLCTGLFWMGFLLPAAGGAQTSKAKSVVHPVAKNLKKPRVPVVGPPPPPFIVYVEELPSFSGNIEKYIRENLWYSRDAYVESHPHKQSEWGGCQKFDYIPKGIPTGGDIPVCFLVDTNGALREITIMHPLNPVLDRAVLEMMRRMPLLWRPGRRQGKPVMEQVNIVVTVPPLSY